jgi:hypothetical protein
MVPDFRNLMMLWLLGGAQNVEMLLGFTGAT